MQVTTKVPTRGRTFLAPPLPRAETSSAMTTAATGSAMRSGPLTEAVIWITTPARRARTAACPTLGLMMRVSRQKAAMMNSGERMPPVRPEKNLLTVILSTKPAARRMA